MAREDRKYGISRTAGPGWSAAVFPITSIVVNSVPDISRRPIHRVRLAVSPVRGISFFGVSGAWLLMMAKPSELSPTTKYSDRCVLFSIFCERCSPSWLRQKRPIHGLAPRINLFQTSQHHWRCSQVCYIIFPAYSVIPHFIYIQIMLYSVELKAAWHKLFW